MSTYACIVGLMLGAIFVVSHLTATIAAIKMARKTCQLLDKQFEEMEEMERGSFPRPV